MDVVCAYLSPNLKVPYWAKFSWPSLSNSDGLEMNFPEAGKVQSYFFFFFKREMQKLIAVNNPFVMSQSAIYI